MSETMTIVEAAEEARQLAVEIIAHASERSSRLSTSRCGDRVRECRPLRVRGSLESLIGEAGELRALPALEEDIALRREAEEVESRSRAILEHAGEVVWTTDTSLRLSRFRGSRLGTRGFGPDGVVGSGLEDCFGTDDPSLRARAASRRPLSGAAERCEGVCGRSYLARTQALGDAAGPIAGVSESQST